MRCFVYHDDEKSVEIWRLSGDLDERSKQELEPLFLGYKESSTRHLILDLSRVSFINSTFLGFVIRMYHEVKEVRKSLCVAGNSKNVGDVFVLLGMDHIIPLYPSVRKALQML